MSDDFSFSQVSRHYFTPEQVEFLHQITIGIAGAGGIGSNCAVLLVRSGFTRFVVADFDRVSASNLNRQAYRFGHIGRLKADCLRELCEEINPEVCMTPVAVRIDRHSVHRIFDGCDAVIEAFDDAAAKAMLFREFLRTDKLLVGASGIAGTGNSDAVTTRMLRSGCYIVGDCVSAVGEDLKPHAPRVMVASAKMADLVLDWALRRASEPVDRSLSQ